MARRIRSYCLENRTARLKLDPRKKPYTAQIAPGIQLAYRRNKGAGVWSVKAPFGLKKFSIANDLEDANGESVMTYWQALDKARTLARAGEGSSNESRLRKFEQVDKWSFCLKAAMIAANRRDHEQTTAPEPQPGFQGEGGACRH